MSTSRGRKSQKGQSLVELLIVLPVLLIIVAGLLDLGRLYHAYVAVTDASGEGASYGAMHPDDQNAIRARAAQATAGLVQISSDQVTVEYPTDSVQVTVTYSFTLMTPLVRSIVPGGMIPLRAVTSETILSGDVD
ncbi:MAG: TadE/TadG family type IV pilus assembly protein [Anaerolineae bacterium]